jgi:hypothetical protein
MPRRTEEGSVMAQSKPDHRFFFCRVPHESKEGESLNTTPGHTRYTTGVPEESCQSYQSKTNQTKERETSRGIRGAARNIAGLIRMIHASPDRLYYTKAGWLLPEIQPNVWID